MFALTAERLAAYYEYAAWMTDAQAVQLTNLWLTRTRVVLTLGEKRQFAQMSDAFARELAQSVSREAGLFISHELMQALDPDYQSAIAIDVMNDCDARVRDAGLLGAPETN
ncbi:MAG TPA: hypothetical protein VL424_03550 [Pararobbsia sp.]|nr:hypothetical protein [Pararobbsia sp.]